MKSKFIGAVALLLVVLGASAVMAEENLSADRGLGLGASVSVYPFSYIPWPFVSIVLSDEFAVSVTGIVMPGVFGVSGALEYRLLDGEALDVLPAISVGVTSVLGYFGVGAGASVIAEYSFSHAIALRATVSLALPLSVGLGISFLYYF
jgi:hypothetical protein